MTQSLLLRVNRNIIPLSVTEYTDLLDRCITSKSLNHVKTIHQHLLRNNNVTITSFLLEKLTKTYLTYGQLDYAHHLFDKMPNPTVLLWNLLIKGYAWNGPFECSVELYGRMRRRGVVPNEFTFPFVLKACASLSDLEHGEVVHGHVLRVGLGSDVYVSTALVDVYAKCGKVFNAEKVFSEMVDKDVVAWNAMIAGFSLHGLCGDVRRLVVEMQMAGVRANSSTVVTVLPVVAQGGSLRDGKAIHGYALRQGFSNEVMVGTGLLDMYGKCGCVSYARTSFDLLGVRNEVTWSAMVGAYVVTNHMVEALDLFDVMLLEDSVRPSPVTLAHALCACTSLIDLRNGRRIHGYVLKSGYISDLTVGNTILSMYAKSGVLDEAVSFFQEMNLIDSVSYGAMISGCVKNGNILQGLKFFKKMQFSGLCPDETTMLALISACSQLLASKYGACAHGYSIIRGFVADKPICNALIDMYAKCGKLKTSREVFNRMNKRDIISWNSMIVGYGIHGLGSDALSLFFELTKVGLTPDDITYIGLLIACSHSRLVEEGKYLFHSMAHEFRIVPRIDHYICMVDLLGRAGLLEEAKRFIEEMPLKPNVHIWNALLAACKTHKNVELAEEASNMIQILGPESTGNFVLMSNIYSCAGRWEDAASIRIMQRDKGFKKSPGCSWVEINGKIHAFIGGDRSHLQTEKIYTKLEELLAEVKKVGYQAVATHVFQDVEEEEKENILLYHSEKLAIAFAILSLSPNRPIFVTKNLRICGDCHEAIKYIALVTKRKITVRDTVRFHHFEGGVCNCGDFW